MTPDKRAAAHVHVTNHASAVVQGLRGEKGEPGSPGLPGFSGPKGPTVSVGDDLKTVADPEYERLI